jgi:hypothetical protein
LKTAGVRLNKSRSPLQKAFALAATDLKLKRTIATAAACDEPSTQLAQVKEQVVDERVAREMEHVVAMRRGSLRETTTIDVLSQTSVIGERNTKLFAKKIPGMEHIEITGRVDGIDIANQTIIEIKNRMNRLFECVRPYEEIQCRVYMWLTGLPKVKLVEDFRGELREYMIEKDDIVWTTEILEPLVEQLRRIEDQLLKQEECTSFQEYIIDQRKQLVYGKNGDHNTTVSDSSD